MESPLLSAAIGLGEGYLAAGLRLENLGDLDFTIDSETGGNTLEVSNPVLGFAFEDNLIYIPLWFFVAVILCIWILSIIRVKRRWVEKEV